VRYTKLTIDHFINPRNAGAISDAGGIGFTDNLGCGDFVKIFIKVKDDVIKDVRFQAFGCAATIAVGSMVTEMAKGRSLNEAQTISDEAVAEALGGLPPEKVHCSNLAATALHKAIEDYREKASMPRD